MPFVARAFCVHPSEITSQPKTGTAHSLVEDPCLSSSWRGHKGENDEREVFYFWWFNNALGTSVSSS